MNNAHDSGEHGGRCGVDGIDLSITTTSSLGAILGHQVRCHTEGAAQTWQGFMTGRVGGSDLVAAGQVRDVDEVPRSVPGRGDLSLPEVHDDRRTWPTEQVCDLPCANRFGGRAPQRCRIVWVPKISSTVMRRACIRG